MKDTTSMHAHRKCRWQMRMDMLINAVAEAKQWLCKEDGHFHSIAAFWAVDLTLLEWNQEERLQVMMFLQLLCSKSSISHHIIPAEFAAFPLQMPYFNWSFTYWGCDVHKTHEREDSDHHGFLSHHHLASVRGEDCWHAWMMSWMTSHGLSLNVQLPLQYIGLPHKTLPNEHKIMTFGKLYPHNVDCTGHAHMNTTSSVW